MARPAKPKPLALDSNILIDLADGLDAAHTFREEFQNRGYSLMVPPTVVTELTLMATKDHARASLARRALQSLREWEIQPYDLRSVSRGMTDEFVRRLIERDLLPRDEFNDGAILAETSLAEIPVLVTSDRHLLDIPHEELQVELGAADLNPVSIFHPRLLLRALH
jgi:predicted nucleic acid-binding protein